MTMTITTSNVPRDLAEKLADALRDMSAAFDDLRNGWPESELHKPPEAIASTAKCALAEFDALEARRIPTTTKPENQHGN